MIFTRIEIPFLIALMAALFSFATTAPAAQTDYSVEERIVKYLTKNSEFNKPFLFTQLYNNEFTSPDERKVLDRLFDTFFKIPSFIARHKVETDRIPTLADIARRFNLQVPGEVALLLAIMENDPRIPRFMERNTKSGEIVSVDVNAILKDERFGDGIERRLVGWTGMKSPPFILDLLDGGKISSAALMDTNYLIYFWFSGCPPCVKTSPHLSTLHKEYGRHDFTIVAVNADHLLELETTDRESTDYVMKQGYTFPVAHLNKEMNSDYGHIAVYPTFFLVDTNGIIRNHRIGYQDPHVLAADIENLLKENENVGKGEL